jgi:hypothetical protein
MKNFFLTIKVFKKSSLLCIIAICIIFFISCKKNQVLASQENILTSHLWYPYYDSVHVYDSLFYGMYDENHNLLSHNVTLLVYDSIDYKPFCQEQSVFNFQPNGVLAITNNCSPGNFTASWKLNYDTLRTVQFFGNDSLIDNYCTGFLVNIHDSSFIYNTQAEWSDIASSGGSNGGNVEVWDHYITYYISSIYRSKK